MSWAVLAGTAQRAAQYVLVLAPRNDAPVSNYADGEKSVAIVVTQFGQIQLNLGPLVAFELATQQVRATALEAFLRVAFHEAPDLVASFGRSAASELDILASRMPETDVFISAEKSSRQLFIHGRHPVLAVISWGAESKLFSVNQIAFTGDVEENTTTTLSMHFSIPEGVSIFLEHGAFFFGRIKR